MGEEQAFALVQPADGGHVLIGQGEVKDLEVLAHPILVGGLGYGHHVRLEQEAQGCLGCGLAVLLADLVQDGVVEEVIAALGEGAPALVLHAVFFHDLVGLGLLLEHMGLHLVDGRGHFYELAQVDEPIRVEVGHANGPDLARLVSLLHGAVGAVVVVKG